MTGDHLGNIRIEKAEYLLCIQSKNGGYYGGV